MQEKAQTGLTASSPAYNYGTPVVVFRGTVLNDGGRTRFTPTHVLNPSDPKQNWGKDHAFITQGKSLEIEGKEKGLLKALSSMEACTIGVFAQETAKEDETE